MTTSYAQHFSTRQTPQTEPIPGSAQVPNSAGGFVFALDDFARLERFCVLGAEGGTYYVREKALTIENGQCVLRCLDQDPERTVRTIVAISEAGRAPRNDAAIFGLAIAAGHKDPRARAAAQAALPKVCRTGTHLFQFAEGVQAFRGWGKGLRRTVAAWYTERPAADLAFQAAKYRQRNGWSHRDLIRLAHPVAPGPDHEAVFRWIAGGRALLGPRTVIRKKTKKDAGTTASYTDVSDHLPPFLAAVDEAQTADAAGICRLIREHNLPRECVPTQHLNDVAIWEALLERMPLGAMVRNLGKMTTIGLLAPFSAAARAVADRLGDAEAIRRARLHPMAVLIAAKIYAQGRGDKGSLTWAPVAQVNDALDAAFYTAFGNVDPAGKRTLLALDVSSSMTSPIAGAPLQCREAAAAMAMITARTEKAYQFMAFASDFVPIDITASDRLADAAAKAACSDFGATDCALPMQWARERKFPVDTFAVYTDSETFLGRVHPCQALRQYREAMGIPARLVVVGLASNGFSIADPDDAGSLDVVGFDTTTPGVIADFSAGRI